MPRARSRAVSAHRTSHCLAIDRENMRAAISLVSELFVSRPRNDGIGFAKMFSVK
jgi:hypothetical protein